MRRARTRRRTSSGTSATRITAHGWTLEIRIPFSSLRYQQRRPADVGHPALPQLSARPALPVLLRATAARQQLLRLPREPADRARASAARRAPGRGAVRERQRDRAPARRAGRRRSSRTASSRTSGSTSSTRPTPTTRSTSRSSPTSRRSSPTRRRSRRTNGSRCSSRRSGRSSSKGVDLFQTPIQAVYTRTITVAAVGRPHHRQEHGSATRLLVADDKGGGSVILPGPNGSDLATQDFTSTDFVGRVKREIGLSSVGMLLTDREAHDDSQNGAPLATAATTASSGPTSSGGRPDSDIVTGQLLYSATRTPNRPDLAAEWTGNRLSGHAGSIRLVAQHDARGLVRVVSRHFRRVSRDNGFVPQVGVRVFGGGGGWTVRPKGFLSRLRTFTTGEWQDGSDRALISHELHARRRHGHEAGMASCSSVSSMIGTGRRPADRSPAVRLCGAVQPVAARRRRWRWTASPAKRSISRMPGRAMARPSISAPRLNPTEHLEVDRGAEPTRAERQRAPLGNGRSADLACHPRQRHLQFHRPPVRPSIAPVDRDKATAGALSRRRSRRATAISAARCWPPTS